MRLGLKVAIVCICLMFGFSTLNLGYATDMPSPSWRTKTGMSTARGQAAVVAGDNGLVYAMGGWAGGLEFSTVEAYNPLTDKWTAKALMTLGVRGAGFAKGLDGIIYVISGINSWALQTTVQAYNTTSNSWSTKTPIPVAVWMSSAATGNDGKIYVIGGEASGIPYYNGTQVYDPSTDSWATGADMPTGRCELRVVKGPDGLIYAMGGYNGSALSIVEAYNPSTDAWAEKTPMPTPKVEFGLVPGPDEKIYVIGGGTNYVNNAGPFFNNVEIYHPETDTWTMPGWSESNLPTARKELSAVLGSNDRIYAIGGANGAYLSTNEEASIVLPENVAPTAYIDSITPNPATRGETITFVGHGSDSDGHIKAYRWRSSINETIGTASTFSVSTLADGTHTIYFSVKDNSDAWSEEATAIVVVNKPITEDPVYQELLGLNETLHEEIDDLTQQNTNLETKVDNLSDKSDSLSQQNTDLAEKVDDLTQQINLMNLELIISSA
ncbi:MAG: kelch repeat-containing protein, partial [Candidatus Bathyarchaeota archaeon]